MCPWVALTFGITAYWLAALSATLAIASIASHKIYGHRMLRIIAFALFAALPSLVSFVVLTYPQVTFAVVLFGSIAAGQLVLLLQHRSNDSGPLWYDDARKSY